MLGQAGGGHGRWDEQQLSASPPACRRPQSEPVSYPKLHLPLEKLQSLFQEQLRVEMATTVPVESVEKARVLTKEVLQAVRPWLG